jgi:hypothetical protein
MEHDGCEKGADRLAATRPRKRVGQNRSPGNWPPFRRPCFVRPPGTAGPNPPTKTAGKGPSATSPPASAGPAVPASISKQALSQVPILGGDYIPCKFTAGELQSLHDPQSVLTLTAADAESLKQNVSREAMMAATNGQIPSDLSDNIIQAVVNEDFTGLTPSQALGRIIALIRTSKSAYTPASPITSPAAKTIVNELNTLPS